MAVSFHLSLKSHYCRSAAGNSSCSLNRVTPKGPGASRKVLTSRPRLWTTFDTVPCLKDGRRGDHSDVSPNHKPGRIGLVATVTRGQTRDFKMFQGERGHEAKKNWSDADLE